MNEKIINPSVSSIRQILSSNKKVEDKITEVRNVIYNLLTTRNSFEELIRKGVLLEDILKLYSEQSDWYRNKGEEWESTKEGDGNPGWIQINCHSGGPKKNTTNIKIYRTISVEDYAFIAHLGSLKNSLEKISQTSGDKISMKFPRGLLGFLKHRDSLVVHFTQKDNIEAINQAIDTWMKESNIIRAERELGRTTVAADHSGKSFSELISQYIAYQIVQNPNEILSFLKQAINSSQKRNF